VSFFCGGRSRNAGPGSRWFVFIFLCVLRFSLFPLC
jgi:hypothetical protein